MPLNERFAGPGLAEAVVSATATPVDLDDVQGILRFGYKHHTEACFMLLRVADAAAARAWLASAAVASARELDLLPQTVLQVALTSQGLHALEVADDIVAGFSSEFLEGLAEPSRSRRLGDVGASDPARWQWGIGHAMPHVMLLLYALPGQLGDWKRTISLHCAAGFDTLACLDSTEMDGAEHFGFADGISQPQLDWERLRPAADIQQLAYTNLACLGEFLLGYPNEYGGYTDRPLLALERDPEHLLLRAEDAPQQADFGRNGSYLVFRQLRQDVTSFWQFLDREAGGDPLVRQQIAEAMVGRTMRGAPLVGDADDASENGDDPDHSRLDAFTFDDDPAGLRCPLGAHIRRSNPRNADLPPGGSGPIARLARTLGYGAQSRARDRVASTRFHRLLRRGRVYGEPVSVAQALAGTARHESGLHFLCLGANLVRQFEFVQGAWLMATKFDGLTDESDPLLGQRLPAPDGSRTDMYSMPQAGGPGRRISGLPDFVSVVGGAYFFLPGIRALRYIAAARSGEPP